MKKALVAGTVLIALSGVASAADLPVKALPPAVVVAYNWTGFYAGVNAGYSWGRANTDPTLDARRQVFDTFGVPPIQVFDTGVLPFPLASFKTNVDGWIGGVQVGWNSQHGTWLWGFEGDFQASGERGSTAQSITFPPLPIPGAGVIPGDTEVATAEYKLKWFGTARLRTGILATERLLLYATGGLAVGRIDAQNSATVAGLGTLSATTKTTRVGWVAGAGAEGALWNNWTAKIEYLYMDLGSFNGPTLAGTTTIPGIPGPFFTTVSSFTGNSKVSFVDHIIRVGVNYRFLPLPGVH